MRRRANRLAELLTTATEAIGGMLMALIVVLNLLQVIFRYVIVSPLGWTEEAMRYSVVWIVFLVAGAALFRGEQMMIDMFGEMLPAKCRRIQAILVLLAISGFCLVLIVEGWPLALRNAGQHSPSAQIPMVIPYMSVVVGGVLTFVKAICLLIAGPERVFGETDIL